MWSVIDNSDSFARRSVGMHTMISYSNVDIALWDYYVRQMLYITEVGVNPLLELIQMFNLNPFTYYISFAIETNDWHSDLKPIRIYDCKKYTGSRIYCLYHEECECNVFPFTNLTEVGQYPVEGVKYLVGTGKRISLPDGVVCYYNTSTNKELKEPDVPGLVEYCYTRQCSRVKAAGRHDAQLRI